MAGIIHTHLVPNNYAYAAHDYGNAKYLLKKYENHHICMFVRVDVNINAVKTCPVYFARMSSLQQSCFFTTSKHALRGRNAGCGCKVRFLIFLEAQTV